MQSTEKGLWSSWMLSTQILCIIDSPYTSSFLTFFLLTMLCGPGALCTPLSSLPSWCFRRICFICLPPSQHCFPPPFPLSDIPHISCGKEKLVEKNGEIQLCQHCLKSVLLLLSLSILSLLGKQSKKTRLTLLTAPNQVSLLCKIIPVAGSGGNQGNFKGTEKNSKVDSWLTAILELWCHHFWNLCVPDSE